MGTLSSKGHPVALRVKAHPGHVGTQQKQAVASRAIQVGQSSPRCLNAVNPAVALSAPKYYLPEKTCGKRTHWLTGAPLTSGLDFSDLTMSGQPRGPAFLRLLLPPHGPGKPLLSRSPLWEASPGRRWFPLAEQRLPALALFPPVRYPRQWLKLTQVNWVTSALRPR